MNPSATRHRSLGATSPSAPAVSVAVRGNILTVADFHGKKILSFRIGPIKDNRHNIIYGCGPSGTDPFEFAGELDFQGSPFLVNSTNVN